MDLSLSCRLPLSLPFSLWHSIYSNRQSLCLPVHCRTFTSHFHSHHQILLIHSSFLSLASVSRLLNQLKGNLTLFSPSNTPISPSFSLSQAFSHSSLFPASQLGCSYALLARETAPLFEQSFFFLLHLSTRGSSTELSLSLSVLSPPSRWPRFCDVKELEELWQRSVRPRTFRFSPPASTAWTVMQDHRLSSLRPNIQPEAGQWRC